MLHHPKRIVKIEKIAQWAAWFGMILAIVGLILYTAAFSSGKYHYLIPIGNTKFDIGFWEKAPVITDNLMPFLKTAAESIFLLGFSRSVRFLRRYYEKISTAE